MSSSLVISPSLVRQAILRAIEQHVVSPAGRPLTVDAIAADLHTSRSTLQRCLSKAGTTYSIELRRVRGLVAVKAIVAGASADDAARRVALSPDHLRKVMFDEVGIGPGALRRCRKIDRILTLWARHPAQSGTRLYRARLAAWPRHRAELHRHLEQIPPRSPLRPWADHLLARSRRPDFRSGPFRDRARAERVRERAAADAWMFEALDFLRTRDRAADTEQLPISAPPAGIKT